MTVTSGVASGLSKRVSGKYLLIPGLVVLAAGMGWVDWAMHADAGRWSFVPGLVVSRFGMGFVWTPAYSLATRDLSPQLGGAASGVINTIQELGTGSPAPSSVPSPRTASRSLCTTRPSVAPWHSPSPFGPSS
jgi:hypothetical protein